MLDNIEDIKSWLKKHTNANLRYIKFNEDLSIDYRLDNVLELGRMKGIKELPIKFNKVHSGFDIKAEDLETLKGFPEEVDGFISISNTKIKNLEYFPKSFIGYLFILNNKELESLKGLTLPKLTHQDDNDEPCPNQFLISNIKIDINEKYFDYAEEISDTSCFVNNYEEIMVIKQELWEEFKKDYEMTNDELDDYFNEYNFDEIELGDR